MSHKSVLNEYALGEGSMVRYVLDHDDFDQKLNTHLFTVSCFMGDRKSIGSGSTKKIAENVAAGVMLATLPKTQIPTDGFEAWKSSMSSVLARYTSRRDPILYLAFISQSKREYGVRLGLDDHDNDRLETLGDAFLGLFATKRGYENGLSPGKITAFKSEKTSNSHLADVAISLGFIDKIATLNKTSESILSDAVEALIGALSLVDSAGALVLCNEIML